MNQPFKINTNNVPLSMAQEMAKVGIVPALHQKPIGYPFTMAGQKFMVTGYANREEFIAAMHVAGIKVDPSTLPPEYVFLRISTD